MEKVDVIIIGGGHAGIEAASAAAKLGCKTLLLTLNRDDIGKLSCNPAIGGVAKGNLVREVDALGGLIGKISDKAAVSYRYLNRSKGKAVWSTRAQVDRLLYPKIALEMLEKENNLTIMQAKVNNLVVKKNKIIGVETNFGQVYSAAAVVICAGTFLKSTIHIGLNNFPGGRLGEESSDFLFNDLRKLKIKTKHFKTGTCARLDKRSLNFSKMTEQLPEKDVAPFSFSSSEIIANQLSCFITYTNKKTHKIISKNLKYSPLYTGKIKSTGVRYCPSLEDKVVKFPERNRHQIFIEPEGRDTIEIYPNGISTSLPFEVQRDFIQSIEGLEKAIILRPGYGIEHGVMDAKQLYPTMELKSIQGLYFAGQVNGTTGYEEAAAQGLIAGVNAALAVKKEKPFVLRREQAFIGVLLDDLTTKGVDEPYRMFTSRCEFHISLRESNADLRLVPFGYKLGLLNKKDYQRVQQRRKAIDSQIKAMKIKRVLFEGKKSSLYDILKRPKVDITELEDKIDEPLADGNIAKEIEIEIKYEGFLRREQIWLKELKNLDRIKIPTIEFSKVPSLSREVIEKLNKFTPKTLGQALRISGMTPAAILNIYNYINKSKANKKLKT